MFTRESISKELKRIQDSVPKMLRENTLSEVKKTPEMEMVFQRALESPDISTEKKDQIRNLLASGRFSKTKIIENYKVAKMRDEYVQREISKSVKAGRLPTKKKLKELKIFELDGKDNISKEVERQITGDNLGKGSVSSDETSRS